MKKQYVLGGVLYNTAKAFGANDTIANSLGVVGGAGEMFLNPLSGGIDAAQYGTRLIQNREFGGLTEFEGATHEQGGITINPQVEVEHGETMNQQFVFSNAIGPKDSKLTYADLSKKIEGKYKKRGEDKMAKEAMQKELDMLKSQHESDPVILAERAKQEQSMQMKYGGMLPKKFATGGPTKPWDGISATPMMQYDVNTPMMGKSYMTTEEYNKAVEQYGLGVINPYKATDNQSVYPYQNNNVTADELNNINQIFDNDLSIETSNDGKYKLPFPSSKAGKDNPLFMYDDYGILPQRNTLNPNIRYNPDEYDSNMQLGPEGLIPSGPDLNQFEQSPIRNSNMNFLNGVIPADVPNIIKSQTRASENMTNGYMDNIPEGYMVNNKNQVVKIPESINGMVGNQPITPRGYNGELATQLPQPQINNQTQNAPGVSSNNKRMFDISQGQSRIPIGGALLNSVGPAAQLAGTLINGVDDVNFERMKADYVDYDPAINIAQREAGNARATNRSNVANYANSGGQALSNIVAGNVGINQNTSNQIARIKQDEVNTNTQIKNNVNQTNLQIGNEEQIARQQNKAAYRQAIYGALSDMGNIGAGYIKDNSMLNAQQLQDQRTLEMLGALPYRYGWQFGEGK